jgi:pyrimidine deaminase RibD-like protein
VIGDFNHPRATCVSWTESFPNIEEFDLVIVVLNTLIQEGFDQEAKKLVEIRSQIFTVFNTGRSVWCIIERLMLPSPPKSGPKALAGRPPTNYDWLFVHPTINEAKEGRSVTIIDRKFEPYIRTIKKWSLEIENVYELQTQYGSARPVIAESFVLEPIAVNKSGRMLGARIVGVGPEFEGSGEVCLLPKPTELSTHEAIETLIDIATVGGYFTTFSSDEDRLQEKITTSKPSVPQASSSKLESREKSDEMYMRVAIELSKESRPEDNRPHPRVGAVAVKNGRILDQAFRGEYAQGDHAEYTLLERKLGNMDLTGTTLYTTLEPCTVRGHEKTPCADRIVQRRIARVVIGMLDPNPSIQGKGLYKLDKAGVRVQLAERLTIEIKELNKNFIAAQERQQTSNVEQAKEIERAQKRPASEDYDTRAKAGRRMLPVSPFNLSPDLEKKFKVVRGYTAAFAIYWNKDSLWIDMWYDPRMPAGFGPTDMGGGEIDAADFLDIVHLNPVLKKYEFGLTGKPRSAIVVIVDGRETEAWVAPLRLVDSLMRIESDRIRTAIRALV